MRQCYNNQVLVEEAVENERGQLETQVLLHERGKYLEILNGVKWHSGDGFWLFYEE